MSQTDRAIDTAPPPPPPPPPSTGRRSLGQDLATFFIFGEAVVILFLVPAALQAKQPVVAVLSGIGCGILIAGGIRMRRDPPRTAVAFAPPPPPGVAVERRVPWDWTDFAMFFPGAFTAAQLLAGVTLPIADAVTGSNGSAQQAAEAFVSQAAFYGGALFNVWLLVGLRRGGTLQDLGWRRFQWWWIPVAIVTAYLTLVLADALQLAAQHLFPSAQNTQCQAVKKDYGNFLALAILVVSVMAPLAEETIFRGFIYGWLARVMPVGFAIVISGVIFGALHGVLLLLIPLWAVGVVLALLYRGSNSLWPGVVTHALFNLPGIIAILSSPTC
ncbi:MAG: lysostaphin resistance A-like protein [Candidatus Dormibacteria bacterium]